MSTKPKAGPNDSLIAKLEALYAKAIVRPEEEKDTGRQNEARNCAFILLKMARDNGVQLKFVVKSGTRHESSTEASATPSPRGSAPRPGPAATPQRPPGEPARYERPKPNSPPPRRQQRYQGGSYGPPGSSTYGPPINQAYNYEGGEHEGGPYGPAWARGQAQNDIIDEFFGRSRTKNGRQRVTSPQPGDVGEYCSCGKPVATRTWTEPGFGCTHVESQ